MRHKDDRTIIFSSAGLALGGQAIGAVTVWTDITDLIELSKRCATLTDARTSFSLCSP